MMKTKTKMMMKLAVPRRRTQMLFVVVVVFVLLLLDRDQKAFSRMLIVLQDPGLLRRFRRGVTDAEADLAFPAARSFARRRRRQAGVFIRLGRRRRRRGGLRNKTLIAAAAAIVSGAGNVGNLIMSDLASGAIIAGGLGG